MRAAGAAVSSPGLNFGPPPPPPCASPPPALTSKEVRKGAATFPPPGVNGLGLPVEHGGIAWPLADGSWAFEYPNMVIYVDPNGRTRIAWDTHIEGDKLAYSVEYDKKSISYHHNDTVIHKDAEGTVVYHQ